MAKIKKKLKKLKRRVKALQDLNTITELRLDKLESLLDDLADNQHDIALNAMVKDLSEEELDEIFNEHNTEELCEGFHRHDPAQLDLFEDDMAFAIANELL